MKGDSIIQLVGIKRNRGDILIIGHLLYWKKIADRWIGRFWILVENSRTRISRRGWHVLLGVDKPHVLLYSLTMTLL